ncbi:MAG: hypothetical protein MI784_17565 [Cytophagales bacterium]|nr:hypothetical protein [Cytophagales bacterium]
MKRGNLFLICFLAFSVFISCSKSEESDVISTVNVPEYKPLFWNDGKGEATIQSRHNCYAYACNVVFKDKSVFGATPGKASGITLPEVFSAADVVNAAKADGLVKLEGTAEPQVGWTKVALFLELQDGNTDGTKAIDFHWYRRDKDGYWSNKGGESPARNTDTNGNKVSDPRRDNSNTKHTYFVCFMAVKSSSKQGEGKTRIK